jgi:hypothetical protein
MVLYMRIFFVLFFVLLVGTIVVGCVKVSVSCKVNNLEKIASAVEDCKEQPNMAISKEF